MIYIVVIVAVVAGAGEAGRLRAVFDAAGDAFTAKGGATGLTLKPAQILPYASLALGSALAAFMYPHTLTGIFASKTANTIRKNAIFLPAYTLLLGLIALLGYMAYAAASCKVDRRTTWCRRCSTRCSRRGSSASRSPRSRSARWCRPR